MKVMSSLVEDSNQTFPFGAMKTQLHDYGLMLMKDLLSNNNEANEFESNLPFEAMKTRLHDYTTSDLCV